MFDKQNMNRKKGFNSKALIFHDVIFLKNLDNQNGISISMIKASKLKGKYLDKKYATG